MKGQNVGYIRVSCIDQNTSRQLDGIELDANFEDHCSGKDTNRPQLEACLRHLRAGDRLHVHSIDHLARSLKDPQILVENLTEQGISIQFHKENLIFSGNSNPMHKLMYSRCHSKVDTLINGTTFLFLNKTHNEVKKWTQLMTNCARN